MITKWLKIGFVAFIMAFLGGLNALAGDYGYNSFNGDYKPIYKQDILKYNIYENSWSYEPVKSELKYNFMESRHEYSVDNDVLKYNVFENEWSYEDKNSQLKYNPFENKWEYAK